MITSAFEFLINLVMTLYSYLKFSRAQELLLVKRLSKELETFPYNKNYFEKYKQFECVPCIRCEKNINKLHSVITVQGYKCLGCSK